MAKKYTDQQKALKLAWLKPVKRFHLTRHACRADGRWPCVWKVWTNGVRLHVGVGKPWGRMGGKGMPVSQLTFGIVADPFSITLWWGNTRLFWIGDWEWKKALSENG